MLPAVKESGAPQASPFVLKQIPVTVIDTGDRPVSGLQKENFRVFEDRIEQPLTYFSSEDAPLSVGIIFDTSGSMNRQLRIAQEAINQFLKTANAVDEFFLLRFSDRPEIAARFTHDTAKIQNQLAFVQARGATGLFDAIVLALDEVKHASNSQKALLVREADVRIYAIEMLEPGYIGSTPENASRDIYGPGLLSQLCNETGGGYFPTDSERRLSNAAQKIGAELRNRYLLGYVPSSRPTDERYRHVGVQLIEKRGNRRLRAYWKKGYYPPSQWGGLFLLAPYCMGIR